MTGQHRSNVKFPKLFLIGPDVWFFEVDKTSADIFGIFGRFLENLLENEYFICSATVTTKTALGIFLRFNYLWASFFKTLGLHFSWNAKEGNGQVVRAFPLVTLFVHEDDHSSLPIPQCPSGTPGTSTGTTKPKNALSIHGCGHLVSDFITTCNPPSLQCFDC